MRTAYCCFSVFTELLDEDTPFVEMFDDPNVAAVKFLRSETRRLLTCMLVWILFLPILLNLPSGSHVTVENLSRCWYIPGAIPKLLTLERDWSPSFGGWLKVFFCYATDFGERDRKLWICICFAPGTKGTKDMISIYISKYRVFVHIYIYIRIYHF